MKRFTWHFWNIVLLFFCCSTPNKLIKFLRVLQNEKKKVNKSTVKLRYVKLTKKKTGEVIRNRFERLLLFCDERTGRQYTRYPLIARHIEIFIQFNLTLSLFYRCMTKKKIMMTITSSLFDAIQ